MPTPFKQDFRRLLASNPTGKVRTDTISISHASQAETHYFVYNTDQFVGMLEDGTTATFTPVPFKLSLASENTFGRAMANITIDNIPAEFADFGDAVRKTDTDAVITYRPYDSSKPMVVQLDEPPEFDLYEMRINRRTMTAKLDLFDLLNKLIPVMTFSQGNGFPA